MDQQNKKEPDCPDSSTTKNREDPNPEPSAKESNRSSDLSNVVDSDSSDESDKNNDSKQVKTNKTNESVQKPLPESEYEAGDLVWGRVSGYPFWPALIVADPITDNFFKVNGRGHKSYHVQFFLDGTRSWLSGSAVIPFRGIEEFNIMANSYNKKAPKSEKKKYAGYLVGASQKERWDLAVQEATNSPRTSSERLKKFAEKYPFRTPKKTEQKSPKVLFQTPKRTQQTVKSDGNISSETDEVDKDWAENKVTSKKIKHAVQKVRAGDFKLFLEKNLDRVQHDHPDMTRQHVIDYLTKQWRDMNDEQKSRYYRWGTKEYPEKSGSSSKNARSTRSSSGIKIPSTRITRSSSPPIANISEGSVSSSGDKVTVSTQTEPSYFEVEEKKEEKQKDAEEDGKEKRREEQSEKNSKMNEQNEMDEEGTKQKLDVAGEITKEQEKEVEKEDKEREIEEGSKKSLSVVEKKRKNQEPEANERKTKLPKLAEPDSTVDVADECKDNDGNIKKKSNSERKEGKEKEESKENEVSNDKSKELKKQTKEDEGLLREEK